jgi:hypothetical protein
MKKFLIVVFALIFPVSLFGMEISEVTRTTKIIKIPLILLPHLDRESAHCLLRAARDQEISNGEVISDDLIKDCFNLDFALTMKDQSIMAHLSLDNKKIPKLSFTLKKNQREKFVKTIILEEDSLSNCCLWNLAQEQYFVEAYNFLSIYFTHAPKLEQEAADLLQKLEVQESSFLKLRSDIGALSQECAPNFRALIEFLQPTEDLHATSILRQNKIFINCSGLSKQKLFEAIINNDAIMLHESIKDIAEEMTTIIYNSLDSYSNAIIAHCAPVNNASLRKYKICSLF